MKIPDEVMKEYRKRSATIDIPIPIVTGRTEISEEEEKEALKDLLKWIEENEKNKK